MYETWYQKILSAADNQAFLWDPAENTETPITYFKPVTVHVCQKPTYMTPPFPMIMQTAAKINILWLSRDIFFFN